MARGRRRDEDSEAEEDEEDEDEGKGSGRKRRRSVFIDDIAIESEDEDDEVYSEDDVDDGPEEEGFIISSGAELPEEDYGRRLRRPSILMQEEQEDVDELERQVMERYSKSGHFEYGEEATYVDQQALLPSVKDPKLWMVKCAVGHERETVICLLQKYIDRSDLRIRSAIALDHLKNYIYVEADKEAYVEEACKGLRYIYSSAKVKLVPIKEMTDVLSVESKTVDLSRDTWVRMKIGIYKGDIAKIADVDNVRQKVTVKLIPRIDLQTLANKLDGRDVGKRRAFVPPQHFFNIGEAREMHIRVERRKDRHSGEHFDMVDGLMFQDGFLYKVVSMKSISTQNIQPTLDELEKFQKPGDCTDGDIASLSKLFANRKKGHFMKGDAVIVVLGDLKNLMGWVEKVEEETVHVRPKMSGLPKTLAFKDKELCKYFKPGDHVKVVAGVREGATGMVVKVEGHVLIIVSDTTKEDISVFADHVVESSEITTGSMRNGDYELHELVLLNNLSFGVIVRVESEAFQVLKGIPDRPEIVPVKLREIKNKIERRTIAQDRSYNVVSVKDVVRVLEGPSKGKQGPVEHIHKGILFIYDRHHLEHSGFICAKAQSCLLLGGSRGSHDRNGVLSLDSKSDGFTSPSRIIQSPSIDHFSGENRGGRGHGSLIGKSIKIRSGPLKGYRGRVKEVTGSSVRVELDSQMKVVTVKRNEISDAAGLATPFRETRYGLGSETPMHPSRTPLHPYQTPMRDPGATPKHDGMRTPMHDRAWAPMSPARYPLEDGNPASWGASPLYQQATPPSRSYEAPSPCSGWANTPGESAASPYLPSTPGGQPMTPNSTSYLLGSPGEQPLTPGHGGLDIMSPTTDGRIAGGDGEGNHLMPDILVNISRAGEDPRVGVVREVMMDGSCKVALGPDGLGEIVVAPSAELETVRPNKSDKIKIVNGPLRGLTGKLLGIDGSDGIVRIIDTCEMKILDMNILAKLGA